MISASRMAQLWPRRCISEAIRLVTRDLPTPPLPLTTAMTFFTLDSGFSALRKLSAFLSAQFSPQVEQSWVHSLILRFLCLSFHFAKTLCLLFPMALLYTKCKNSQINNCLSVPALSKCPRKIHGGEAREAAGDHPGGHQNGGISKHAGSLHNEHAGQ